MKRNMNPFNFLDSFVMNMAQTIHADDRHPHGYYMVVFSSSPYTVKENKTIHEQVIYSGELVSN